MLEIIVQYDEINSRVISTTINSSTTKVVKQKRKLNTNSKPTVELNANKLILSESTVQLLNASPENGDRIAINYINASKTNTFPIIGKSDCFADKLSGNKLTKSNTVSFKGLQNTILSKYGFEFELEFYKNGIYKLIPTKLSSDIISEDMKEIINNLINK